MNKVGGWRITATNLELLGSFKTVGDETAEYRRSYRRKLLYAKNRRQYTKNLTLKVGCHIMNGNSIAHIGEPRSLYAHEQHTGLYSCNICACAHYRGSTTAMRVEPHRPNLSHRLRLSARFLDQQQTFGDTGNDAKQIVRMNHASLSTPHIFAVRIGVPALVARLLRHFSKHRASLRKEKNI